MNVEVHVVYSKSTPGHQSLQRRLGIGRHYRGLGVYLYPAPFTKLDGSFTVRYFFQDSGMLREHRGIDVRKVLRDEYFRYQRELASQHEDEE